MWIHSNALFYKGYGLKIWTLLQQTNLLIEAYITVPDIEMRDIDYLISNAGKSVRNGRIYIDRVSDNLQP
jgi:hypothetical protein